MRYDIEKINEHVRSCGDKIGSENLTETGQSSRKIKIQGLAREFLKDNPSIINLNSEMYDYVLGCYRKYKDEALRSIIHKWICEYEIEDKFKRTAAKKELAEYIKDETYRESRVLKFWQGEHPNTPRFDHHVPFNNGILDLISAIEGKPDLRMLTPLYFCTYVLPYDFLHGQQSDLWLTVLEQILPDEEDRALLQEWFGLHLITDDMSQRYRLDNQYFMVMEGAGSNGKSVILAALAAMVGENQVSHVALEMLHPSEGSLILSTIGSIANITEELDKNENFPEGYIKQFVSKNPITVDRKYKSAITLRPTALLTVSTNQLPTFIDRSNGIWRRLLLLRFSQIFEFDNKNPDYKWVDWWQEGGHLPGIFNWALGGAAKILLNRSITETKRVKEHREELRRDSNPTLVWIEENLISGEDESATAAQVYEKYRGALKDEGQYPLGSRKFLSEVRRKFPHIDNSNFVWECGKSTRKILGIRLRLTV